MRAVKNIVNNVTGQGNADFSTDSDSPDSCANDTSTDECTNMNDNVPHTDFMYMSMNFSHKHVNALLDTGCSINVISEYFFNSLPKSCKSNVHKTMDCNVQVADSRHVVVKGTAKVQASTPCGVCTFEVYIMPETSHPLIIGTEFMSKHNIVLDLGIQQYGVRKLKVKCTRELVINPTSECVVMCKLPKGTSIGTQGICTASKKMQKTGLLVSRSLTTVHTPRSIPVKILNPCPNTVVLPRCSVIADFDLLDGSYQVLPVDSNVERLACNTVNISADVENNAPVQNFDSLKTDLNDGSQNVSDFSGNCLDESN